MDHDDRWAPAGLNPCFRFEKYEAGQEASAHMDDAFISLDAQERSFLSLLIYLNDGFSGGHTVFVCAPTESEGAEGSGDSTAKEEVIFSQVPVCGTAMIFQHDMLHAAHGMPHSMPDGAPAKIVVRTDVVYRRC
jgi:hypothetical protein